MATRKSKTQPGEGGPAPAKPRTRKKAADKTAPVRKVGSGKKKSQQKGPQPLPPPTTTMQQEMLQLARGGAQLLQQVLVTVFVIGVAAVAAWGVWSIRPMPSYSSPDLTVGSPFDLTFKVENESPWFALANLKISCILDHVRASGLPPSLVDATDVQFPSGGISGLEPGESATFTCPFRALIGHTISDDADIVRRSEIYFRAEYDVPVLRSFRLTDYSVHFVFDTRLPPPRWVAKPRE